MTAQSEEPAASGSASLSSHLQAAQELIRLLAEQSSNSPGRSAAAEHDLGKALQGWRALLERIEKTATPVGDIRSLGRARKVSVSLPEGLTAVVQQRVGKGEFSHYVAEAVARQLELDLLTELAALLEAEHGPIPEKSLAEAEAAWPDVE